MSNNNYHQNFNCEFAPEIVDFLYGEMKENRQSAFNLHLNKCADCAGEVRDFSEIKFSIQDWKASEFNKLSTPEIIIPYEKSVFKQVETEKSLTILQSFRRLLSISPVYSGAVAAVIIGACLLTVSLFLLNGKDQDLLAENNSNPNANPTKVPLSVESTDEKNAVKIEEPVDKSTVKDSVNKADKTEAIKILPIETVSKQVSTRKEQNNKISEKKVSSAAVSNTANTPVKTTPVKKKPRLNELPEEDEDKSLRLADLFAELETRE